MMLKKYLSAYIFPIFKKANVIKIDTTLRNNIIFIVIDILKNNIPTDMALNIIYNICLNDK